MALDNEIKLRINEVRRDMLRENIIKVLHGVDKDGNPLTPDQIVAGFDMLELLTMEGYEQPIGED